MRKILREENQDKYTCPHCEGACGPANFGRLLVDYPAICTPHVRPNCERNIRNFVQKIMGGGVQLTPFKFLGFLVFGGFGEMIINSEGYKFQENVSEYCRTSRIITKKSPSKD